MAEHMSKEAGFTCVPGEQPRWAPKIYSPRKRKYLEQGAVPVNWRIKPSHRPDCGNVDPVLLSFSLQSGYIVFENGSLYPMEYSVDTLVHPDKYCIDYNTALVSTQFSMNS